MPPESSRSFLVLLAVVALTSARESRADELRNPVEVRSENGVCDVVLEAAVRTQPFPAAGAPYSLRAPVYVLRMANGKVVDHKDDDNCLVGPTLRVKRGDLLKIRIKNGFDPSLLPSDIQNPPEDYPQDFSITNLHTHGLHISPSGKADNVFVSILPGEHHQYEYRIPANHPAGMFWYHPHRHGSVALQLTSGMAGALIVEGDDDVLSKGGDKPVEKIMVLQQIHGSAAGNLLSVSPGDIYDKINSANTANSGASVPQKSMRVLRGARNRQRAAAAKKAAPKAPGQADPCADDPPIDPSTTTEWLLVNGQNPQCRTIPMHLGEIQRWRFVHAGVDEVINLVIRQTDKDGNIQQVPFFEIAVDGIPRGRAVKTYGKYLYPAYRVDVLFKAPVDALPEGTKLELWSEVASDPFTLNGGATTPQRIAIIQLDQTKKTMDWPDEKDLGRGVPVEFRGGISDAEINGRRWPLRFSFPADQPSRFTINGHEYAMDRIDRHVKLGTAEEWLLQSDSGSNNNAGHPFHVHVNPFLHYVYEVARSLQGVPPGVSVTRQTLLTQVEFNPMDTVTFTGSLPTGEPFTSNTPVTDKTTLDDLARNLLKALNAKLEDSYRIEFVENGVVLRAFRATNLDGLKIDQTCGQTSQALCFAPQARQVVDLIWRDTLMAPSSRPAEVVRMRFRDFTGDTVLHCHIVDHEDQGMMMNIRIHPADVPGPDSGEMKRAQLTKAESPAPEFALPDAAGKLHRLTELIDKLTVLIFFRGKGCIHCNRQLTSFARLRDRFTAAGVNMVAVSSTGTEGLPRTQGNSSAEDPFPFLLLADAKREAFKRFGCIDASDSPLHGTFVLDRRGKIRWSNIGMEPYMDVERVLAEVARHGS